MWRKLIALLLIIGISLLFFLNRTSVRAADIGVLDEQISGFQKFIDPLPIPPKIVVPRDVTDIDVSLTEFKAALHTDLPQTVEWGYNGTSPGPTIEVEKRQKIRVHWKNELPTTHVLKTPTGIEMGNDSSLPDVRNITHLHGAVVTESSPMDRQYNNDGWPDAWNVPGQVQIAEYPNDQDARILWYHDHAIGTTGRNVAAGLVGMYLIHDDYERSLNLPSGDYDVPLIIQSRGFNGDGSLYYSRMISAEYYGNTIAINGKLWPYMNVEPRKYRFRVLDASNARAYALRLVDMANTQNPAPPFYQIGSDSGFLENTVVLNDPTSATPLELTLLPAERADIIVDFSKYAGHTFLLANNMRSDDPDSEIPLLQLMLFKVGTAVTHKDTSSLPMKMRHIVRMDPDKLKIAKTRQIVFGTVNMADGSPMLQLNGKSWTDPVEEKPVLGTTEVWELINATQGMNHPFHIHLVQFQILDRRPFDLQGYLTTGKVNYTGPAVAPDPNEMGWKDTVRVPAQEVTRIIMTFAPYPGYYVYHCHILEHEDMDMMRPLQIVNP